RRGQESLAGEGVLELDEDPLVGLVKLLDDFIGGVAALGYRHLKRDRRRAGRSHIRHWGRYHHWLVGRRGGGLLCLSDPVGDRRLGLAGGLGRILAADDILDRLDQRLICV